MLADRVFVGSLQQAVHLALRVVVPLNLPHAELVRSLVAGVVGDCAMASAGSLRFSWKSMNRGMSILSVRTG